METIDNIFAVQGETLQLFRTPEYLSRGAQSKIASKKPKIFLVDDDSMYLKALELSVSGSFGDMEIYSFKSGEECLKHLNLKPAVVILDYYLNSNKPDAKDGMQVLKRIKRIHPKTKVIVLSAQDSLSVAIDCMENGAYDYIAKSQTSFLRVNNLLDAVFGDIETSSTFFKTVQYLLLIILFVIIASILINH